MKKYILLLSLPIISILNACNQNTGDAPAAQNATDNADRKSVV